MFTRFHKLAFASLAIVSIIGGSLGGLQKSNAGKLRAQTVVYDQATGLYTDDFADATGVSLTSQAGVDVASGMVKLKNVGGTYTAPYLASGSVTLQLIWPTRVAEWGNVSIVSTTPAGTSIKVQALDDTGAPFRDENLPGNEAGISVFPADMGGAGTNQCANQFMVGDLGASSNFNNCTRPGNIYIKFLLATTDPNVTPSIDSMQFTYAVTQGDLTASGPASGAWAASQGDQQNTGSVSYHNAQTYPAFRWVTPAYQGDYQVDHLFSFSNRIIGWSSYYTGYMFGWNRTTGAELWRQPFNRGSGNRASISSNGTLYFSDFGNDAISATDTATGQIKWRYYFGGGHGNSDAAIDADGTIYTIRNNTNLTNTIYAFNPDGSIKWTKVITSVDGAINYPTPISIGHNGKLYFATLVYDAGYHFLDLGILYALDPADGAIDWSYATGDINVANAPVVDSTGTIYVSKRFFSKNLDIKILAINPDGTLKWQRNFGTGDVGVFNMSLNANGDLLVVYQDGSGNVTDFVVSSADGATISDPFAAYFFQTADGIGGLYYPQRVSVDADTYTARINYYDANQNLKWQIPYTYDSADGLTNYSFQNPIIDENGWLYSAFGKHQYDNDSDYNDVPSQEYARTFALAPWTLTPASSNAVARGDNITFSVTTSMQETNPLTTNDNQMQIVLDTGVKVPLAYSSIDAGGNTTWTGTYSTPVDMDARLHTYTVQANADMVKTDIVVAFDTPAGGSENTGITATGTFMVQTKGGSVTPPSAPPEPTVNDNSNVNAPLNNTNQNTNIPLATPGLNIPGKPAVYLVSSTEARIVIDQNGNTPQTRFFIQDAITGKYVQDDGVMGDAPVFKTFADWGGDNGIVAKVKPNTRYRFRVAARPGI